MDTDVTAEQKFIKSTREEIERKHGKTPEELYEEREKRVMDAIHLREPDRVPVSVYFDQFPLYYFAGASPSAIFYDMPVYRQMLIRTLVEFEPDLYRPDYSTGTSGHALEAIGPKQYRWPGGNLPPDYGQQFLEVEVMKPDEYDLFMTDPTDFILRYFLPRTCEALEPLSQMPTLGYHLAGSGTQILSLTTTFTRPEFRTLTQILFRAGEDQLLLRGWDRVIEELGFPPNYYFSRWGGNTNSGPPFDLIANHLRGMRGIMMDMFRQPEKLLAACERIHEWRMARAVPPDPSEKEYRRRVLGGATHFSSSLSITKQQFAKFSWPSWKKGLQLAIDLGWIPNIFCEGNCDDRLEYFLELPKGKFYVRFAEGDMAHAKAVLGDHCCICGNVPASLLKTGSVQDVEDYCKNLIKVCGKHGGFILETASSVEAAKPANIKAMIDSAEKYGRY